MGEADSRIEVLKEIRDEIRGVRGELEQLRVVRVAGSGVRTERVERGARWRNAAMASTGALAVLALAFALRADRGRMPLPPEALPSVTMAPAPPSAAPTPAPAASLPPRTTSAPLASPAAPLAQPGVATKAGVNPMPSAAASPAAAAP